MGVDARLIARHQQLALEHMNASERLSAGLKTLPDKISRFAGTQADWRFYGNNAISLSVLRKPLTAAAYEGIVKHCSQYALCVHDWSHLNYKRRSYPPLGNDWQPLAGNGPKTIPKRTVKM